mmetsp:Transcript_5441/g.15576  ORF Transcript_5441/g.15576 Transcript_5441/m.15576 type:complete len:232 (+) Transcript_5441:124-819(+)
MCSRWGPETATTGCTGPSCVNGAVHLRSPPSARYVIVRRSKSTAMAKRTGGPPKPFSTGSQATYLFSKTSRFVPKTTQVGQSMKRPDGGPSGGCPTLHARGTQVASGNEDTRGASENGAPGGAVGLLLSSSPAMPAAPPLRLRATEEIESKDHHVIVQACLPEEKATELKATREPAPCPLKVTRLPHGLPITFWPSVRSASTPPDAEAALPPLSSSNVTSVGAMTGTVHRS